MTHMTVFTRPLVPPQVLAGVVKVLPCNQSSDTLLWSTRVHRHTRLCKEVASTEGNLCNTELIVDWWKPPIGEPLDLQLFPFVSNQEHLFVWNRLKQWWAVKLRSSKQHNYDDTRTQSNTHIVCIRCILLIFCVWLTLLKMWNLCLSLVQVRVFRCAVNLNTVALSTWRRCDGSQWNQLGLTEFGQFCKISFYAVVAAVYYCHFGTMINDVMCVCVWHVLLLFVAMVFIQSLGGGGRKWVNFLYLKQSGIHTHPTKSLTSHLQDGKCDQGVLGSTFGMLGTLTLATNGWLWALPGGVPLGTPQAFRTRWDKTIGSWGLTGVAFLCWVPSRLRPEGITISRTACHVYASWNKDGFDNIVCVRPCSFWMVDHCHMNWASRQLSSPFVEATRLGVWVCVEASSWASVAMQILGPEEMFLHVPFNVEAVDVELETGSDETSIKHVVTISLCTWDS